MRPLRRIALLTALTAAVWALLPAPSSAQIDLPILTSPTPSPSPSPTASPKPKPKPTPKPAPTNGSSGSSGSGSSGSAGSGSGGGAAKGPIDPVIAEGLELWREREKSPARTTTRLLELIERAHAGPGAPTFAEKAQAFGRFPVVGYVWYQDDYGAARYTPYYSFHEGSDLFAVKGTPVIAVADGAIWKMGSFSKGGNAIWLMGDDGIRYYYGHLAGFARGLRTGQRVALGQLLGFVGDTGNAKGTYPHVHFEVNPGGLGTINPKPVLDAWLNAAETALVTRIRTHGLGDVGRFGAARWDLLVALLSEPGAPPPALWAAALGGSGAMLAYADLALADLLAVQDWDALVGRSGPQGASGAGVSALFDPLAAVAALVESDAAGHNH